MNAKIYISIIILRIINIIIPKLLNNIIELANHKFAYSHISFNSNGDMIIDSSSKNNTHERKFYGLKKNGGFYFNNPNYELGYFSMIVNNEKPRYEGESFFIKLTSNNNEIHGRELLLGISRNTGSDSGFFTEIYNLNDNNYTKFKTYDIFGWLIGETFSVMEGPDESDSKYYYIFCYSSLFSSSVSGYYLNVRKIYFSFDSSTVYHINSKKIQKVTYSRIVSSFYTENKILICFYVNENKHLMITAFDQNFDELIGKELNDTEIFTPDDRIFLKGIHLKDEIGVFIYFIENMPKMSIIQYNSNKTFISLFEEINLNKANFTFNEEYTKSDIVKLNNNRICYISVSTEKDYFQFILINLYKNDQLINIKYYQIEINITYNMLLYNQLKASLYNQYIALAFTYNKNIEEKYYYCSLIIFNYPNSEDTNLDVIQMIYRYNKKIENDFSFNFEEKLTIDNNLFGFVLKGTKIILIPNDIHLTNIENNNIILNESIILKNENVSLSFANHDNYTKNNYIIEYSYILEEPDYDSPNNNNYMVYFDDALGNQIEDEKNYYQNNNYIGKLSYFTIVISEDLTTNCNNDLCSLCFINYTCVTCNYNYIFNENLKTCLPNITTDNTLNSEVQTEYIIKEILKGKYNEKISKELIEKVVEALKEEISSNSNFIIETKNVIFQISSLDNQKNNNNPNISSIDLGICEEILKKKEGLSEEHNLIIFKIDIKSEDLSKTYVLYEIFNPITLKRIDMEACENIPIGISVPVNLDENTKNIFYSLNQSGYNLFDLNDSFYNDICSTYTTEYNTDLTLIDRKSLIYDKFGNISMCQINCKFKYYDLINEKAKCDCDVQIEETVTKMDINKLSADELANDFYKTLKNSNFIVMKCIKLVFSKKGQKNNIGSYLISVVTFIFIIFIFIYIFNGYKKLDSIIQSILDFKLNFIAFHQNNDNKELGKEKESELKESKENIIKDKNEINMVIKRSKSLRIDDNKNIIVENLNNPPKRINFDSRNRRASFNGFISSSYKSQSSINKKLSVVLDNKIINKIEENVLNIENIENIVNKNLENIVNKQIYLDQHQIKELNDEELNNLEYENALIMDKRTFFQYYLSLLKKKHLIIFTFYPSNDYNLMPVKIALFLLSFSLFFTINGFFFSDSTMNKIYEDKGIYNFLFQIPQILYSTIVSAIINVILKQLSLSEKQILTIKSQINYKDAKEKSESIKKCLKIKMIIFSLISFLFMLFFWYFISAFCSVYKNTQIILIKDTLISFSLSMIYPFGIILIPCLFRIPALKTQKHDKKCLYKTSKIIAFII